MRDAFRETEQQIAELATRFDPVAFINAGDPGLDARRRLAWRAAVETLHRLQTYMGLVAGASVTVIVLVWLYSAI